MGVAVGVTAEIINDLRFFRDFRFFGLLWWSHCRRSFVSTPRFHHYLCTIRIKSKQLVSLKRLKIIYPEESFCQLGKELTSVVHTIRFSGSTADTFDAVILARCFGLCVSIFDGLIIGAKFLVMQSMGEFMEQ